MEKIEKFNPSVKFLTEVAEKGKNLKIKGVEDKEGYDKVVEIRKELVKWRRKIDKQRVAWTKGLRKEVKNVNKQGADLIALIEPTEKKLKGEEMEYNALLEIKKREASLPRRREELKELDVFMSYNEMIRMDDEEWVEFKNNRKNELLEEREAKIKADEAKIEADKEKLAMEARLAEVAKESTRNAKLKERQRIKDKVWREKQQEEQKKIQEEARIEREKGEKRKAQRELEANNSYKKWLKENGVTKENFIKEFYLCERNGVKILYKKISTYVKKSKE